MVPLSPKVIERSNKELIALHKRLIASYLVCRGIKIRSKAYYLKVVHWQNLLAEMIPRRAVVHNVLVTTEGLTY